MLYRGAKAHGVHLGPVPAFDLVSDMGKIRRAGFAETVDSAEALIAAIRRQQDAKILPR